ncbi:protein FAM234B [Aplochiton taeniatus]
MAAALSRAIKLTGKKGSELGEYDPLTQADSDDESEEDDLVLNYPRNGLGRGNCASSSDLKGGRTPRLVGGKDEAEEEEEEEDEWREHTRRKSWQESEKMKGMQYWNPREADRDGGGDNRGETVGSGGSGMGSPGAASADPDRRKARTRSVMRASFFLVPLVCAMMLVLLCAFLVPCQKGELDKRPQWEREMGDVVAVTPSPALALWDVDGDSIEDVLLGVTDRTNDTQPSLGNNKVYSVVALSAVSGQVLWRRVLRESAMYIQCGLQYEAHPVPLPAGGAALRAYPQTAPLLSGQREQASGPVCLLIGKTVLTAVNGTTGKKLWSVALENIESQAVPLPDLQGDTVPDLLIATLAVDEASDLKLILLSGLTGAKLGHPVPFNLTEQGRLIGPLLHETQQGAYYILFGLGTVEAVSLRDIYVRATGKMPLSHSLRLKDPGWEKLKKTNSSSLIHISRDTEQVDFLLPLVAGLCNNHNSLDAVSNLNASRSDWVMVSGANKLSVLRERDAHAEWTVNASAMHSRPTPGHFNGDGIPDVLVQQSGDGIRKVQVFNGPNGCGLWAAQFICPSLKLEGSSIATTSGVSAFLFWAGDPLKTTKNVTKTTVPPGVTPAGPFIRKLYLLHPTYPTILMQLASTTDTILSAAVSYEEQQKDASYITVSSRPTSDSEPGAQVVKSMSLRAAVAGGQIVRLGEGGKASGPVRPGVFEINKFFRRLSFKH